MQRRPAGLGGIGGASPLRGEMAGAGPWQRSSGRKLCGLVLRNLQRSTSLTLRGVVLAALTLASLAVLVLYVIAPPPGKRATGFLHQDVPGAQRLGASVPEESMDSNEVVPADVGAGGLEVQTSGLIRGASPGAVQRRYAEQRASGRFACFDGSRTFPSFEGVVNDDFCDCADGSDEPGTSACSGIAAQADGAASQPALQGFSCGWPLDGAEDDLPMSRAAVVIRFGAVNDGICDCCGGEDEWDGATVCPNRCDEVEAEEQAEASRSLAGSRAREAYVQRAATLKSEKKYEAIDGGPDGVFIAAAAEGCLKLDDGDYTFEVCLFDRVSQKSSKGGRSFVLGRDGKWAESLWEDGSHRKDYTKLIMDNGEYCAASGAPRKAEVMFECAATPALLTVQEAQVCVYTFRMLTPAACHPLHHQGDE
mmetsp:Transcript_74309/g.205089  ORF Transcript_74309/g.205089 Transcript_74309/m.205089 type:complete len:422 (+) Transcript_74309:57-1322(+)